MDCRLPEVLDALSGGPVAEARMVAPPWAPRAEKPPEKVVYGQDLAWHLDGEHFSVQWEDPEVDAGRAAELLAQLEDAWTLVDDDGWPAPTSADAWLLRVVLDPALGGSGYTTVYADDTYPEGYPVSYLNPTYALDDPLFERSVAVHEFAHMLQHRLRDESLGRGDDWFWEATAEWTAEHAAPELDRYAESTFWYAQWPEGAFDTSERYHAYGMLLLDAWLDEAIGFDGIRDVWITGEDGRPWEVLVAEAAGSDFGEVIDGMATATMAGTLRESPLYTVPSTSEWGGGWEEAELPGLYGTTFVEAEGADFTVEGPVLVTYLQDGQVFDTPPEGPFVAVITAVGEGALAYGVPPEPEAPAACGCQSSPASAGAVLAGLFAVFTQLHLRETSRRSRVVKLRMRRWSPRPPGSTP